MGCVGKWHIDDRKGWCVCADGYEYIYKNFSRSDRLIKYSCL